MIKAAPQTAHTIAQDGMYTARGVAWRLRAMIAPSNRMAAVLYAVSRIKPAGRAPGADHTSTAMTPAEIQAAICSSWIAVLRGTVEASGFQIARIGIGSASAPQYWRDRAAIACQLCLGTPPARRTRCASPPALHKSAHTAN